MEHHKVENTIRELRDRHVDNIKMSHKERTALEISTGIEKFTIRAKNRFCGQGTKFTTELALKAQMGSRGKAPVFL